MQTCRIKIKTVSDGRVFTFSEKGNVEILSDGAIISYNDGQADIVLKINGEKGEYIRKADCGLRIPLETGKNTQGTLTFGSSEGTIGVFTEKIKYFAHGSGMKIRLSYLLGTETDSKRTQMSVDLTYEKEEERK